MIRGIHGLLYSTRAGEARAFLRDKLRLPFTDVGEGWLIFDLPEGDLGIHPAEEGEPAAGSHDVSFYCDDIEGTVAELRGRGVEFTQGVEDHGYGLVTYFALPGGVKVQLYEPRYVKRRPSAGRAGAAGRRAARKKPARPPRPAARPRRPSRAKARRRR